MANPNGALDPLGIFGGMKAQVDQMAAQAKVPQALRPQSIAQALDPLRLFTRNNSIAERAGLGKNRGV